MSVSKVAGAWLTRLAMAVERLDCVEKLDRSMESKWVVGFRDMG